MDIVTEDDWVLYVTIELVDDSYVCRQLKIQHCGDQPVTPEVVRSLSVPELIRLAERAVSIKEADGGPALGAAITRARGATATDLARVAEVARGADKQGLSRSAVLMREMRLPERTAYRRLRAAIDAGLLEER